MAIDIASLSGGLDAIPSATYAQASQILMMLGTALQDLYSENALLRATNIDIAGGDQQKSLDNIRLTMTTLLNRVSDTSSHSRDDDCPDWSQIKQMWISIATEANAIGAGDDATLSNLQQIPDYIGQSVAALPQTIGGAVSSIGAGAGSIVGSFLQGLGLPFIIIAGVVIYFLLEGAHE